MAYRVHFIGLKVNKNLDWQLALLLSVYFWRLNGTSPICGVASGQLLRQTRGPVQARRLAS